MRGVINDVTVTPRDLGRGLGTVYSSSFSASGYLGIMLWSGSMRRLLHGHGSASVCKYIVYLVTRIVGILIRGIVHGQVVWECGTLDVSRASFIRYYPRCRSSGLHIMDVAVAIWAPAVQHPAVTHSQRTGLWPPSNDIQAVNHQPVYCTE